MPSQVVQAAPNSQQHVQTTASQSGHQHLLPKQLQPMPATHALQMQQKLQMTSAQTGPVVAPSTAATPAAAPRTQHVSATQHPQYQYQQRNPTAGVPMGQQHAHMQSQPQFQQQQRPNPANVRAPQYSSQPVTVVSNNGTNPPSNHSQQQQQQQQQMPIQHFRQPNPQQRLAQHTQQRTQPQQHPQQHPQQPPYATQTQVPNPNRSVPTPPSQHSLSSNPVPTTAPNSHTPLYERLVTEEAKELKEYVRLIEQQSRRISDLEKIHLDLERRLESQTAQRQRLEYTLQQRERYWKATTDKLEGERTAMESTVKEEKMKVEKLLDMVNRLQNEIQSMIKNKFNPSRGTEGHLHGSMNSSAGGGGGIKKVTSGQAGERSRSGSGASGSRSESQQLTNSGGGGKNTPKRHIGPHELLACNGSAEAVRERNALTSLMDFFGM